jgi:catechol 2,3-dioxygenase
MPAGTRVGHIHLHVALLRDAERFYCERLGFDLVIRYGPSALFVSAGGYHHHIGLNTWAGVGVPEAPPDAVGLSYFTIDFEDDATRRAAAQGLRGAGKAVEDGDARSWVEDPSGVRIALVVRR